MRTIPGIDAEQAETTPDSLDLSSRRRLCGGERDALAQTAMEGTEMQTKAGIDAEQAETTPDSLDLSSRRRSCGIRGVLTKPKTIGLLFLVAVVSYVVALTVKTLLGECAVTSVARLVSALCGLTLNAGISLSMNAHVLAMLARRARYVAWHACGTCKTSLHDFFHCAAVCTSLRRLLLRKRCILRCGGPRLSWFLLCSWASLKCGAGR